jgi:uncharacterized membrane protein YoaK (UPF0700 family)
LEGDLKQKAKIVLVFVAGFFRDHNDKPSMGRLATLIIVIALAKVMLHTGTVPDNSDKIAYVLAALFGANQLKLVAQALAKIKGNSDPAPDSAPATAPGQ